MAEEKIEKIKDVPNCFLAEQEAQAILDICDAAIRAPNSNVDVLSNSKNALRARFVEFGIMK